MTNLHSGCMQIRDAPSHLKNLDASHISFTMMIAEALVSVGLNVTEMKVSVLNNVLR